ncbi:MAG TPA: hypothetical protein VFO08_06120 [Methylomirabilota bacterium]|jgi:hypothetical protein|nr:hypothetical protein [Methylomirabilota bacterium]
MSTRIRFLLVSVLIWTLAGCARPAVSPGLVCVPAGQPPPYAAAGSWYCQEVSVSVREPGTQVVQHRTGQFADLIVSAVGRCPERPGQFAPSVTVKNIGPVPAGAFNVAIDVGVFDRGGAPVASTAAVVRVAGLAANADTALALDRMPGVMLRAGDRLTISAIADPQQVPGGPPNVFGEVLELDETNNGTVQNCAVPD